MNGRTIGAKPRPRALIAHFDEATTERISELFPTARTIEESLDEVHPDEWDVLVLNGGGVSGLPRHLYLIGFGCDSFGYPEQQRDRYTIYFEVTYGEETLSQEFQIPDGLHPDVRALVERELLPLARGRDRNPVITESAQYHSSPASPSAEWLTPFLMTAEPRVLAGSVLRVGAEALAWCIPSGVADPIPWVRAAMRVWHTRDPSRFPFDPGWPSDERWMTGKEIELLASLKLLQEERQAFIEESRRREEELRTRHVTAANEADQGLRRLLTAQGDDLVDAVQGALEALGFTVQNRDLVNPVTDRLEDLWVTSPADDTGWIALVEVKGYMGGAQVSALLSISGRFVPRFFEGEGRYPARRWYVANQFIGRDPGTRPPILASNPSELSEFESQDGMVIDTAVLFSLARDVEIGRISRDIARQQLMSAVGRYAYDPNT